jgi:AcrR family transcriptional regulator
MTVDRRVQRTRTALYDALVRLIRMKPYDEISVADILGEADVGRSTFYAHFTSKDDLLARSLDRLKALLTEVAGAQEAAMAGRDATTREVSRALFAHVAEYRDIPLALAGGRGATIVSGAIGKALADTVKALPLEAPDGVPRELAVEFVVATFATVLRYWLERRPGMTAVEADETFLRLVRAGLGEARQ